MMEKTYYSDGKDQYKNYTFDGNEWSAPYMIDASEIRDRINSFNLVGRKIQDIRFVGHCYNLIRDWIEEYAYNAKDGTEEEKQHYSEYKNISPNLMYLRYAEIDEPLMIRLENKTEPEDKDSSGLGNLDIFEIEMVQVPEFRMSMNCIPWGIDAGTNLPNMEADVLFSPCIGQTITAVEVNTYRAKSDPLFPDHPFEDGSPEKELVSSIILRLENGDGLCISGQFDFTDISYVDKDNKTLRLSFAEIKEGLCNWEDIHDDEGIGFKGKSATFFFGKKGSKYCPDPFMTLSTESSESRLHIYVDDFILFAWSMGDLYEWFDEYGEFNYTYNQWQRLLSEAEKLLSFTTFDELFSYRTGINKPNPDDQRGNYFLSELNISGARFWKNRNVYRTQLEEIREWTSIVMKPNDTMSICGF